MIAPDKAYFDPYSETYVPQPASTPVYTPIKSTMAVQIIPEETIIKSLVTKTTTTSTALVTTKIPVNLIVYDEFGSPLPLANIHIDGKMIASTGNDGTVYIPNVATSTSIVKVTYMGMIDYTNKASLLPKTITMKPSITQLETVVINAYKKPTTAPLETAKPAQAKTNWLLLLIALGIAYKGIQHYSGPDKKIVKAKL